jgi:hypothetical protein
MSEEFSMTFFEAMQALEKGHRVTNNSLVNPFRDYYKLEEESSLIVGPDGVKASFDATDFISKWRIFEDPEVSWLDEFSSKSKIYDEKMAMRFAAKEIIHEAIRRIEAINDKDRAMSIDDAYDSRRGWRKNARVECVNVLRTLIGEF